MARVAIVGAGITGISCAYYLLQKGYDVTIYESNSREALEASFQNTGQLSFSHTNPLYKMLGFKTLLSSFFSNSQPYKINISNPRMYKFYKSFLRNAVRRNSQDEVEIAEISKKSAEIFYSLPKHLFNGVSLSTGIVHVFNKKCVPNYPKLCELDPTLAILPFNGGYFCPDDATLDCYAFSQNILDDFAFNGGKIKFSNKFVLENRANYDAVVLSCAARDSRITSPLNVAPLRGYSVTFDITGSSYIPRYGYIDEQNRLVSSVYHRVGEVLLRVAGFGDVGFDDASKFNADARLEILIEKSLKMFPFLNRRYLTQRWTSERLLTPNSVPIIDKHENFENVVWNVGHGTLGVTMSFGCADKVYKILQNCLPIQ